MRYREIRIVPVVNALTAQDRVDTPAKTPVMVPPLQAKLELLKKSENVPSVYDELTGDTETVNDRDTELELLIKAMINNKFKKGNTSAKTEMTDTDPFEG